MSSNRKSKTARMRQSNSGTMYSHSPKRKSSAVLTLALMGGAALIVLNSCDDDNETAKDGVFFSSPLACMNAGNSAQVCNDAWNKAKDNFEKDAPSQLTRDECEKSYGNCYLNNSTGNWSPIMMGFLLANAMQQNRDNYYVSSGGGYISRPVWSNSHGDYVWRTGSSYSLGSSKQMTKTVSTVSRGGFGRSSSARGSWGG